MPASRPWSSVVIYGPTPEYTIEIDAEDGVQSIELRMSGATLIHHGSHEAILLRLRDLERKVAIWEATSEDSPYIAQIRAQIALLYEALDRIKEPE
jgi:hypothetical protein